MLLCCIRSVSSVDRSPAGTTTLILPCISIHLSLIQLLLRWLQAALLILETYAPASLLKQSQTLFNRTGTNAEARSSSKNAAY